MDLAEFIYQKEKNLNTSHPRRMVSVLAKGMATETTNACCFASKEEEVTPTFEKKPNN